MQWHKILYPPFGSEEPFQTNIETAFSALCMAAGNPKDAALFSSFGQVGERAYYFSPACSTFCSGLYAQFGAVPCEKPTNSPGGVIGHHGAASWLL